MENGQPATDNGSLTYDNLTGCQLSVFNLKLRGVPSPRRIGATGQTQRTRGFPERIAGLDMGPGPTR